MTAPKRRAKLKEQVVTLEPLAVKRSTAAAMLECGVTTVWKLVREGKLKTIKIGADDRITVESIKALVAKAK